MAVPTTPTIDALNPTFPADTDQEAEGAGWLRFLQQVLIATQTTLPGSDNSNHLASTAFVYNAILNAVLTPGSLPAQVGNAGKFLQTDGANVSWQSAGSIVRIPVIASQTVVSTNKANLLECSGPGITLSFAASTSLASGYFVYLRNAGSDVVTMLPSGAETIQGRTTWPLNPGDTLIVLSDGSALYVLRLNGDPQFGTPGTPVVVTPTSTTFGVACCALSSSRSMGMISDASGFPVAVLRDATGAVIATQLIESTAMSAGVPQQIVPLTSTTAALIWVNASAVRCVVLTDNGLSIGVGSVVNAIAATSTSCALVQFSATKLMAIYANSTTNVRGVVLTVTGNAISVGTLTTLAAESGSLYIRGAAISATQAVVLMAGASSTSPRAVVVTEAAGVLTPNTATSIATSLGSGSSISDIIYAYDSRLLVYTGKLSTGNVAYAYTVDVSGTGAAAKLLVGPQTPAPVASSGTMRLARVNATTFVVFQPNSAGLLALTALFVRASSVLVGSGCYVAGSTTLGVYDVCLMGQTVLPLYYDNDNSGYPTSRPIPIGSIL